MISWSWYFSHTIAVFFTLLALYEFKTTKRYFLIGLYMGLVFLTRYTAGFTTLFFILTLLLDKDIRKQDKIRRMSLLLIPILFSGMVLLALNYARFGDFFNNGYMLVNNVLLTEDQRFELLNYGLFQIRNIPTNLYYYFIKSLDPVLVDHFSYFGNTYILEAPYIKVSSPGTSFFIASPVFLYLFVKRKLSKEVRVALIPIALTLLTLLAYFYPGWRQVGPRYTIDFLPLLMLVLFESFENRKLPNFARGLILLSAFINLHLLLTVIPI